MTKLYKSLIAIALSFMCAFVAIGYAAVTTELEISGTATIAPVDGIIITDVTVEGGMVDSFSSSKVFPTNVQSSLSGSTGDTVTYKITAHNYSKDKTFVYKGTLWTTEFNGLVDISVVDSNRTTSLPIPAGSAYIGTPIAPGEDFVFYATYTLKTNCTNTNFVVNYEFIEPIYTVTYLNNNEVYAVDYIVDNSGAYDVRSDSPTVSGEKFNAWVNAAGNKVTTIPKDNENNYTLSATWKNKFLISFVDSDGTVLYQEYFVQGATSISEDGQKKVDTILGTLQDNASDGMIVTWEDYNLSSATGNVTVRAVYEYNGVLNISPVDEDGDGIIDYYEVLPVDTLDSGVIKDGKLTIPGNINGLDVKVVNRVTNTGGGSNWNNYAESIEIIIVEEGVVSLEDTYSEDTDNSLAYTPNLKKVYLPSTLEYMGKNTFSRNYGDDKKAITIVYNGTITMWESVMNASVYNQGGLFGIGSAYWYGGLQSGTKVICTDGYFLYDGNDWDMYYQPNMTETSEFNGELKKSGLQPHH